MNFEELCETYIDTSFSLKRMAHQIKNEIIGGVITATIRPVVLHWTFVWDIKLKDVSIVLYEREHGSDMHVYFKNSRFILYDHRLCMDIVSILRQKGYGKVMEEI